ncbi:hypothetical protein [Ensifer canadensis]
MKTLVVAVAAIGLSASTAFAECAYHAKTNAAVDTTTTASITTDNQPAPEKMVLLKKTSRLVQNEKTAE